MKPWLHAPVAVCLALAGGQARAHEFECIKTVEGSVVHKIAGYPERLDYELVIRNTHPTDASVVLSLEDRLLAKYGLRFNPSPPFSVPVGGSTTYNFQLEVANETECLKIAGADGREDRFIDNSFEVGTELGGAMCTARVICSAQKAGDEDCPDGKAAKRGLGFWKNHVDAAAACLAPGPIDLGLTTLTTLADVEGVLWGSPARHGSGEKRSNIDQKRFILMRELLVATCNVRVLGAQPETASLFDDARAVLRGTDCNAISSFVVKLDLPRACDRDKINTGQMFGPADPKAAQALAADPTMPSGDACDKK